MLNTLYEPDGRDLAIIEGKKANFGIRIPDQKEYPASCPFSPTEILDLDFFS